MAKAIRIISLPPGAAPLEIRQAWIGLTIPLATAEELAANPPSGFGIGKSGRFQKLETDGHYYVLRVKALQVLREQGRHKAADYWSSIFGSYLDFDPKCYKVIG